MTAILAAVLSVLPAGVLSWPESRTALSTDLDDFASHATAFVGIIYPADEWRLPFGVTAEIVTGYDFGRTPRLVPTPRPYFDWARYPIELYRWKP